MEEQQIQQEVTEQPKKKSKLWIWIILILIALGIGAYFLLSGNGVSIPAGSSGGSIPQPPALPS